MAAKTNSPFQTATSDYRSSVTKAVESSAKAHNLRVHPDSVSVLVHDAIPGGGAVACAAVEGVGELSVDELFGGSKPALLVYLPTSTHISGPSLEEGVYAVTLDASEAKAGLHDAEGNHVVDAEMETGSVPANRYLAAKAVVTDIGPITTCVRVCVRVCFSIEIDGPGPFIRRPIDALAASGIARFLEMLAAAQRAAPPRPISAEALGCRAWHFQEAFRRDRRGDRGVPCRVHRRRAWMRMRKPCPKRHLSGQKSDPPHLRPRAASGSVSVTEGDPSNPRELAQPRAGIGPAEHGMTRSEPSVVARDIGWWVGAWALEPRSDIRERMNPSPPDPISPRGNDVHAQRIQVSHPDDIDPSRPGELDLPPRPSVDLDDLVDARLDVTFELGVEHSSVPQRFEQSSQATDCVFDLTERDRHGVGAVP